jgi:GGDEF domain-containing protein
MLRENLMKTNYYRLLFMLFLTYASTGYAENELKSLVDKNSILINDFYTQKNKATSYNQIVSLAREVIKNSTLYNDTLRAKAFALLADAAIYQGNTSQALQFAQDGLTQGTIDIEVQLNLLLKISAGLYLQSNYNDVLNNVEKIITLAQDKTYLKYRLNAYGYQATIYALQGDDKKAYAQLNKIDLLLKDNPSVTDQVELLQILALAHHNLKDYDTSLALHLKLLKIQFDLTLKENIERTYYYLALAYLRLKKYDDAYNAFWQVKMLAEKKSAPILLAYAELGLGETFYEQKSYDLAYTSLIKAEKLFRGKTLTKPYLTNLIILAKVAKNTNREIFATQLLKKAEKLAMKVSLDPDQIILYQLLADYYQQRGEYKKAYSFLTSYLQYKGNFSSTETFQNTQPTTKQANNKSKDLALKLSENGALYANYAQNYKKLSKIMWAAISLSLVLTLALIFLWLKQRSERLKLEYNEIDPPKNTLPSAAKTKKLYQKRYKEARKFEYPLTIAYIVLDNWQDLSHHFNKKIMLDIHKTIATIINENISEFDQGGYINDGEYIVLYPHRTKEELSAQLQRLSNALNARVFANLGDFSIIIKFSAQTANIQDIDPFVFLAQLSESLKNK